MDLVGNLKKVAVIVPLYKESLTINERFSFEITLSTLSKHDIYVICPKRLSAYMAVLSKDIGMSFYVMFFDDKYFYSIRSYNKLMTSISFYKKFQDYEYILIVQTDALVIFDNLLDWCNCGYSYIGAPWFNGFEKEKDDMSFLGVGNGGFSLRKVSDFVKCLSSLRYIPNVLVVRPSNIFSIIKWAKYIKHHIIYSYNCTPFYPKINEDVFWGILVPLCNKYFIVPAPEIALSFAFEVNPEYLFEMNGRKLPFGCHAWEKYDLTFWRSILKETGICLP